MKSNLRHLQAAADTRYRCCCCGAAGCRERPLAVLCALLQELVACRLSSSRMQLHAAQERSSRYAVRPGRPYRFTFPPVKSYIAPLKGSREVNAQYVDMLAAKTTRSVRCGEHNIK